MRKVEFNICFLLLLCISFIGCKKTTILNNKTIITNNERDYFLCPDWYDFDFKNALYRYENVNDVKSISTMKVYRTRKGERKLYSERFYKDGLLIKENHYPDTADDSTSNYVYDDKKRLIRFYDTNTDGFVTRDWNYSYSYDKDKNELVCIRTDQEKKEVSYRESVEGNKYHITEQIVNNDHSLVDNYLTYDENGLSEIIYISRINNSRRVINRNGNKITITGYRKNGDIFELQEYERNEDSAVCTLFYVSENSKKLIRKDEFFGFDKHDNWTINKENEEILERVFEYND